MTGRVRFSQTQELGLGESLGKKKRVCACLVGQCGVSIMCTPAFYANQIPASILLQLVRETIHPHRQTSYYAAWYRIKLKFW